MTIIATATLTAELPSDADGTAAAAAIARASDLTNAWSVKYYDWPESTETVDAPDTIKFICLQIAKACYYQYVGETHRDGNETETWSDYLDGRRKELESIDVKPEILSTTISLDSNGVQLLGRSMAILTEHPECRVVSDSSNVWNQWYHWYIRRGNDSDNEQFDGWYLDAESYKNSIEGTLYYARSWRNDGLDYQRYYKTLSGRIETEPWRGLW